MSTLLSHSQRVAELQVAFRSSKSTHRVLASTSPCPSASLTCVSTKNQVLGQSFSGSDCLVTIAIVVLLVAIEITRHTLALKT